jgi:hypothetical protein
MQDRILGITGNSLWVLPNCASKNGWWCLLVFMIATETWLLLLLLRPLCL